MDAEEKPLAGTRERLEAAERQKRRMRKRALETPRLAQDVDRAVGMMAAGMSNTAAARALGLKPNTLQERMKDEPGALEEVHRLRAEVKLAKLRRSHRLEAKLWDRAEQEVDGGVAKDVDALMRAVYTNEKVQAAAAGEGLKVEHSGAVETTAPKVELKVLLQQLLGRA